MHWNNRILGAIIVSFALGLGFAPQAQAGYVVTLSQVGSNVVANGSGAVDLTGLTNFSSAITLTDGMQSNYYLGIGGTNSSPLDAYNTLAGPSGFGSGNNLVGPSATSGDPLALNTNDGPYGEVLFVPKGYTSGASLTDSGTWNNTSFANLGLTAGTSYEWTWGSGANQNFTINISNHTVPDPGTLALLVPGLAGLGFLRRRKRAS